MQSIGQVSGHLTLELVSNHLRGSRNVAMERNGEFCTAVQIITFVLYPAGNPLRRTSLFGPTDESCVRQITGRLACVLSPPVAYLAFPSRHTRHGFGHHAESIFIVRSRFNAVFVLG